MTNGDEIECIEGLVEKIEEIIDGRGKAISSLTLKLKDGQKNVRYPLPFKPAQKDILLGSRIEYSHTTYFVDGERASESYSIKMLDGFYEGIQFIC